MSENTFDKFLVPNKGVFSARKQSTGVKTDALDRHNSNYSL